MNKEKLKTNFSLFEYWTARTVCLFIVFITSISLFVAYGSLLSFHLIDDTYFSWILWLVCLGASFMYNQKTVVVLLCSIFFLQKTSSRECSIRIYKYFREKREKFSFISKCWYDLWKPSEFFPDALYCILRNNMNENRRRVVSLIEKERTKQRERKRKMNII